MSDVRWSRDTTGRFTDRPFYDCADIERRALEFLGGALSSAGQSPVYPLPDDHLVLTIESVTELYDPYADLSKMGIEIDGYTSFSRDKKPSVWINRDLEGAQHANRRRMTIAHELGHIVLHQPLYERDSRQLDLLVVQPLVPVYCAKTQISRSVDWCEWQASFFGAALLMPSLQTRQCLESENAAFLDAHPEGSLEANRMAAIVSRAFKVSKDAARVRLAQIGLIRPPAAQALIIRSA